MSPRRRGQEELDPVLDWRRLNRRCERCLRPVHRVRCPCGAQLADPELEPAIPLPEGRPVRLAVTRQFRGVRRVDRDCGGCGELMKGVHPVTLYCPECARGRRLKYAERARARRDEDGGIRCQEPGCRRLLSYRGTGRYPRYCPDCNRRRNAAKVRRIRAEHRQAEQASA